MNTTDSNRITQRFQTLAGEGRQALICFITAGDPSPEITVPLMHRLVAAGADILELGVPFSDPMADGPVIQRASERALAAGMTLPGVLDMVRDFRTRDRQTPVVFMGYANPLEAMGHQVFARAANAAGVDGVLTVDLPLEEAESLTTPLRTQGIAPIFLLAPNTEPTRMARICQQAGGFLYYVSLKGVTGAGHLDTTTIAEKITEIRALATVPVAVGFGVKDAATAARIAKVSDAVVIGSALVEIMETFGSQPERLWDEIAAFLTPVRAAIDSHPATDGPS